MISGFLIDANYKKYELIIVEKGCRELARLSFKFAMKKLVKISTIRDKKKPSINMDGKQ